MTVKVVTEEAEMLAYCEVKEVIPVSEKEAEAVLRLKEELKVPSEEQSFCCQKNWKL